MKRVLMIDAQVFHTVAWHRGMGKYSTELIAAMAKLNYEKKRWDSVEIILSSRLPLEDEVIKILNQKIDSPKFVYLDLARDEITNASAIMGHNRKIIDQHIDRLIVENSADVELEFLVLSPMQGGICSVFPTNPAVHKAAVFYDLIPFMFHEIYFRNKIAEMEFLTKLVELLKSDIYLAISKTVANDLAIYLGVDPARIKSIDGGPIEHAQKSKKLNINKPFILMPTGNDLRKNNRLGIQGFNEFNQQHDNSYTLVITSYFDPDQVVELSKIAENIVFTGNISGEELNYLYEECEVLLFPSEYEGLGLPVLEAMEKNKPVACSDIMVFREISNDAFYFFDPAYGTAIAAALELASVAVVDKSIYTEVLKKYAWESSALATLKAFENVVPTEFEEKKLLTIFGPNPEGKSMAARTVQRLHSELSRRYATNYFIEGEYTNGTPRPNMLPFVAETLNVSKDVPMNIKDESVMTIYHVTGDQDSSKTLFAAIANPGILVLHTLEIAEVWRSLFEEDGMVSKDRYEFEILLNEKTHTQGITMMASLVSHQKAIIVFSQKSQKIVKNLLDHLGVDVPIFVANYPVSSLVYKELVPGKKNLIGALDLKPDSHGLAVFSELKNPSFEKLYIADDTRLYDKVRASGFPSLKVVNDRYFENNISRLDLIAASGDRPSIAAIEAARYGVGAVYIDSPDLTLIDLPKSHMSASGIGELSKIVDKFAMDSYTAKLFSKTQSGIENDYSYRSFVELIGLIIDKLEGSQAQ